MRAHYSLILLPVLALATTGGGDEVGNGDDLAEQQVIFAYSQLANYLDTCLEVSSADLSAHERELLGKIRVALPEERRLGGPPRFASERDAPSFFRIDGEIKTARTGSKVGDPIYINRDRLRFTSGSGSTTTIDAAFAAGLFVHEFGHHHGVSDEAALDLLGAKVRAAGLARTAKVPAMFNPELQLEIYFGDTQARLGLRDSHSFFDATPDLVRHYCGDSPLTTLALGNPRWETGAQYVASEGARWWLRYTVSFDARYVCENNPKRPRFAQTRMRFLVKEEAEQHAQSVQPASLGFE